MAQINTFDAFPPIISNVKVFNFAAHSVDIYWMTDEPADSRISFGTSSARYLNISENRCDAGGYVINHCVRPINLLSSTTYYFIVNSNDLTGNHGFSNELSFKTISADLVAVATSSDIGVIATTTDMAIISATSSNLMAVSVDNQAVSVATTTAITTTATTTIISDLSFQGTARDFSGHPVDNAVVYVHSVDFAKNFKTLSDANGFFQADVPPGSYLVEIFSPLNRDDLIKSAPVPFSVLKGEKKVLNLEFSSLNKTVSGYVRFSDNKPALDAVVSAYNVFSAQSISGQVDVNGKYFLNLGPGKWVLRVRPADFSRANWRDSGIVQEIIFGDDESAESKVNDFAFLPFNAKIIVKTVDEKGLAVPFAGVVLDTASALATPIGKRLPPDFRSSAADGSAVFNVPAGRYYLRAHLPEKSDYLNPEEEDISVAADQETEVIFTFLKKEKVAVIVKGITKLYNGGAIDAVVWAWSQKGRSVETRSNVKGEFSVSVPAGDRWSFGAATKFLDFAYKADQTLVDVADQPVFIELNLAKASKEPLSRAVQTTESATQQIIVQSQDGARINLPPAAAADSGTVRVDMNSTVEVPSQSASKIMGAAYDITLKDSAGRLITQLQKDMEIILPYDKNELKNQAVSEDSLVPSFFDDKTGVWVKVDDYVIDKAKSIVIIRVKHLTRFALLAAADVVPPAAPPVSAVSIAVSGSLELTLVWKNPEKDFANVKIYRSANQGVLGALLLNDLTGTSVTDKKNLKDGVVYYYTVRWVDPAGNESTNVNQVFAKAAVVSGLSKGPLVRNLKFGSSGNDIKILQRFLMEEKVYPEAFVTGYFGFLTKQAVIKFQEKYKDEILKPFNLTNGTGFVGVKTRVKINAILGK